jgi:hypothetical protein
VSPLALPTGGIAPGQYAKAVVLDCMQPASPARKAERSLATVKHSAAGY